MASFVTIQYANGFGKIIRELASFGEERLKMLQNNDCEKVIKRSSVGVNSGSGGIELFKVTSQSVIFPNC